MAAKCAADVGNPNQVTVGLVMFYRLLSVQIPATAGAGMLATLPRVNAETRSLLVTEIDEKGVPGSPRESATRCSRPDFMSRALRLEFRSSASMSRWIVVGLR